ncbi:DNA-3-methyladenine glycosylase 2 family protein [Demequina sp.]|uniref:DNA-3-methyladenine glycosylase 2 family protein n=1 Tax=Demequina sp. TaxID=2050685 RepID=UPI003A8404F1
MTAPALDFDRCYAAVSGRDARFDGQFVLAVRSTGIYCRPSCPARTPIPANCTFYATSAAAHVAGYRACKRCLPEAVPGSPRWNVQEDVAARAMRLIGAGAIDREGVSALSARLGYSSRQLTRILTAQLGAGPLALARAQRAHTARQLLVSTALPVADIAFASGFRSIRQFNDTVADVFGLTPTQVRAHARRADAPPATGGGALSLRLRARAPFAGTELHDWFAARAVAGVEDVQDLTLTRSVALTGGPATFTSRVADDHVQLTARLARLDDLPDLLARVRRLYDLEADPVAIDTALAADPALAASVAARPGLRVPGTVDPFEMLVRAILGQQVTVGAARGAVQRLVDALGTALPESVASDTVTRAFPTPAAVAAHAHDVVRGPASRTRALVAAAQAVASGHVRLDAGRTLAELTGDLEALRGIGPWTSYYVAMRVLGSPDVLLTGDSAVRAGAKALGLPHDPPSLEAYARRHRPWRSYLMMHLWRAGAPATRKE